MSAFGHWDQPHLFPCYTLPRSWASMSSYFVCLPLQLIPQMRVWLLSYRRHVYPSILELTAHCTFCVHNLFLICWLEDPLVYFFCSFVQCQLSFVRTILEREQERNTNCQGTASAYCDHIGSRGWNCSSAIVTGP
jgi:hypothetical protein